MADIIFPGDIPQGDLGLDNLPGNLDLSIWQGDSQSYYIVITAEDGTPINLNGYSARATIKQNFASTTKFSFTVTQQQLNKFLIYLPSAISKTLTPGSYVWEFQTIAPNGDVRTYVAGDVNVYAEVDAS